MSTSPLPLRHAVCLLLLLGATIPATAQTTLGTIRGTIFDPQQQIVPGATVVITDESTSVAREALTDAQGLFEIPNLRPGTYAVAATITRSTVRMADTSRSGCPRKTTRSASNPGRRLPSWWPR